MAASYIPEGYNAVIPALAIKGAAEAIEWYIEVFGAKEKMILTYPDKTIAHGEIKIDDSVVMISEENPEFNKSAKTLNGNSVHLCIYVKDVDTVVEKAKEKGAKVIFEVTDHSYGDRSGRIEDPFGYTWIISTAIKTVPKEEMQKMMEQWSNQQPSNT